MTWQGTKMPAYPRAEARGIKELVRREEQESRVGEVTDLESSIWKHAIQTVMMSGCGLLLSPTSDGGAVSLTLYFGDERGKGYASTSSELERLLNAAVDQAMAHHLAGTPKAVVKAPSKR